MTLPNLQPPMERMLSPPPPPVISNGTSTPQAVAVAPVVVEPINPDPESMQTDEKPRDAASRRSWADVKVKKETEGKQLPLSTQLELEIGARKVM